MIKRFIDVLVSLIILIILLPFILPVMLILKLTGEHYIFYKQPRVGQGGKTFNIMKFSTMLQDSPHIGAGEITLKHDPRVFPFGRILRKHKINEIPQLLNVLKGDMSFVGPRPLTSKYFGFYKPENQDIISRMKPGITGMGSIMFYDEEGIFEKHHLGPDECYKQYISPYKATLEKWYFDHKSIWLDIKIVFCTVWVVLVPNRKLIYKIFKDLPEKPGIIV